MTADLSVAQFVVSHEMTLHRLDQLLFIQFPQYSRTYFQYLIQHGFVTVNGARTKKKEHLREGDKVMIALQQTPEISVQAENLSLEILFEDDHLIAVNKPAGMVVHPAPGHASRTLVNGLLYHCRSIPHTDPLRPGIVHRLDKGTSGVLLAAKTTESHRKLVEMFRRRQLEKIYLAICVGSPGDVTIEAPIKRHPTRRKEMTITPGGRASTTVCTTLAVEGNLSLVEILLVTGRTHQIRVHLKHHKTPVLGDPIYGSPEWNKKSGATSQLLHAHRVKLIHPMTGELLHLIASLPERFGKHFTLIPDSEYLHA